MINLSQSSPLLKVAPSSSGYRCGCGDEFSRCVQFKEHSLLVHDGQYIDNSSHFLSSITNVVLPVQRPTNNETKDKTRAKQTEYQENWPCEIETASNNQSVSVTNTAKRQKEEGKSLSTIKTKKGKSTLVVQPIVEDPAESDQNIEWNGFQLIKNKKCQIKPFYCGKCKITFAIAEELIIHCIEVCKRLKHRDSSHLISCSFDQLNQSENEEEDQKSDVQQKQRQKKQIGPKKRSVFNQIIVKDLDHRKLPFYCGYCHKNFENAKKYHMDIKANHSEIIHLSSSHIILRFVYRKRTYSCYITENVEWPYQQQEYFCSCKPDMKMNMAKLIKHVRQIHRGISPIYPSQYSHSHMYNIKTYKPQRPLQKKQQSLIAKQQLNGDHSDEQEQEKDEKKIITDEQLRKIFYNHKNGIIPSCKPPYICYRCKKQFMLVSYTGHIKDHHMKKEKNHASHIIIRMGSLKATCLHITISVSEQWRIKDAIYTCPCGLDKKMTMKELTKHIADQHNYFTVYYHR